jgi:hypothetical protein
VEKKVAVEKKVSVGKKWWWLGDTSGGKNGGKDHCGGWVILVVEKQGAKDHCGGWVILVVVE